MVTITSPFAEWCFTLNNPASKTNFWNKPLDSSIKYAIWQIEKSPSTNTIHVQGYVELSSKQRLSALKKWISTAHWERRLGSREQAREYCRKAESRLPDTEPFLTHDPEPGFGPWEFLTFQASFGQGHRSDLDVATGLLEQIEDGSLTYPQMRKSYKRVWMRYGPQIRKYVSEEDLVLRDERTRIVILRGPPGSG